jgi:hypothetical protein
LGAGLPLTIGKMYDTLSVMTIPFSESRGDDMRGPFYLIKCDTGEEKYIEYDRFRELTLDEKRDIKLEEILKN